MKVNSNISPIEHRLLKFIASLIFILSLFNFASFIVKEYNDTVEQVQQTKLCQANNQRGGGIDFSTYGFTRVDLMPHFHFYSFLIFLVLLFDKKLIFSTLFTFLSVYTFSYELNSLIQALHSNESAQLSEILPHFASSIDFIIFFLVFILLFWQIFLLLRILLKSLQRNKILP